MLPRTVIISQSYFLGTRTFKFFSLPVCFITKSSTLPYLMSTQELFANCFVRDSKNLINFKRTNISQEVENDASSSVNGFVLCEWNEGMKKKKFVHESRLEVSEKRKERNDISPEFYFYGLTHFLRKFIIKEIVQ